MFVTKTKTIKTKKKKYLTDNSLIYSIEFLHVLRKYRFFSEFTLFLTSKTGDRLYNFFLNSRTSPLYFATFNAQATFNLLYKHRIFLYIFLFLRNSRFFFKHKVDSTSILYAYFLNDESLRFWQIRYIGLFISKSSRTPEIP